MKMARFFNTAGPIRPEKNYCIDPLHRINLDEILSLIQQEKYFVVHAPRQTGKTSYLLALTEYLNQQGTYKCLYTNIESAQAARENVFDGMREILNSLASDATYYLNDPFFKDNGKQILDETGAFGALKAALSLWCQNNEKPVVLFIDEIDSLVGDTLISVLRQLRSEYPKRPRFFPQSIILCGVRDVRDYRIHSDQEKTVVTGGSAFNIKSESLRLGNFTGPEIEELYTQHTTETGQPFHKEIFPLIGELTEGQPWLVNALAYETCFKMAAGKDRCTAITVAMINQAKENLILRRVTHLDQLSDKLKEERVRRVIEPILVGAPKSKSMLEEEVDYVVDLGLIKKDGEIRIANRIYQELIPRTLTYSTQLTINQESSWYKKEDSSLDMDKLLTNFQDFFRMNFESWVDGFQYQEAGPQLLLQAFLQRIVNGGGRVEREYGLGRQRTDILVLWPYQNTMQRAVIELKLLYGKLETTIQTGMAQTYQYMDKCNATEGFLLVINKAKKISWQKKIFKKTLPYQETQITVFGM